MDNTADAVGPVGEAYTWSPPDYDTTKPPSLENSFKLTGLNPQENFARIVKWCPDGSGFLAHCEDRSFQLFNVPPHARVNPGEPNSGFTPTQTLNQPSPILDFTWYPAANSLDPASFCFVASVRECPVKLLDASDGRLRASYRIVDHRERQIAPHSLAFNLSAQKLYCGFEDAIEVFDLGRPGEGTRLMTTPSKKSKDGLKGIISSIAFAPSEGSDFYAAGSLFPSMSNIAMFSESHGQEPIMYIGGGPRASVTQLHFNPLKPHIMYAAFRRHPAIYSWDVRANVESPVKIYRCKEEAFRTNQKMRFDVDLGGRWLGTGDQLGNISIFDLEEALDSKESSPVLEFSGHADAVGSVSFHPFQPMLLSVSGSRHFHPDDELSSSSDETDDSSNEAILDIDKVRRSRERPRPIALDCSIKMWNFGSSNPQA